MGYFCTKFANDNITLVLPPVSFKAKWLLIFFVGIDVIFAFVPGGTGTAHMAHIGGAVIGILWVKIISNKHDESKQGSFSMSMFRDEPIVKKSFFEKRREKKENARIAKQTAKKLELKEQVDALLDKILSLIHISEPTRPY